MHNTPKKHGDKHQVRAIDKLRRDDKSTLFQQITYHRIEPQCQQGAEYKAQQTMKEGTMTGHPLDALADPAEFVTKRAVSIVYIREQRADPDHEIKDAFFDDEC